MHLNPSSGVRCHKCRHNLQVATEAMCQGHDVACPDRDASHIYLNEERLPNWIRGKVEEERWTKGKLHCPSCGGRVGSFDFVAGRRCACGQLPAVHLVRSQVDTALPASLQLASGDALS